MVRRTRAVTRQFCETQLDAVPYFPVYKSRLFSEFFVGASYTTVQFIYSQNRIGCYDHAFCIERASNYAPSHVTFCRAVVPCTATTFQKKIKVASN